MIETVAIKAATTRWKGCPWPLAYALSFRNGEAARNLLIACAAHAAGDEQIPPFGRNDKLCVIGWNDKFCARR